MLKEDGPEMQAPQSMNDKHGPGYDNDTGDVWYHCKAESKPGFDHSKKRR
jgi:hypothetical protein